MAQILGESGRYVSDAAQKEWRKLILIAFSAVGFLGVIAGVSLSTFLPLTPLPLWAGVVAFLCTLTAIFGIGKRTERKMEEIAKKRRAFSRGADGEIQVARALAEFPDDFRVIHDLTTPFGNVDHVVIGPTGVFILDAKAWRGVVTPDGKGELLINGQPTDKPQVRPFLSRMLSMRDKVRTLAPGLDPFYQAVFVFTSARVDAKWGTTGNLHCIRDEQLRDYIVLKNFGKRLLSEQIQTLSQAFLALAHMDRDFTARSTPPPLPPMLPPSLPPSPPPTVHARAHPVRGPDRRR